MNNFYTSDPIVGAVTTRSVPPMTWMPPQSEGEITVYVGKPRSLMRPSHVEWNRASLPEFKRQTAFLFDTSTTSTSS